jgi:HSP20 family protein
LRKEETMALTRWEDLRSWEPFRELEEMSKRFDRIVRRTLARAEGDREAMRVTEWAPSVDIAETEQTYEIRADLPGVRKEDVHVSVEQDVLTLQGERHHEHKEEGKRFHRVESMHGSFMRRFTLPNDADGSKISAQYEDGILTVTIPKTEAKPAKSTEIQVQ